MMAPEPPRGQWLLPMLAEFLGYSGEALRILNGTDQADKWLLVRRAVEYDLRLSRADGISDQTFKAAAAALRDLGQRGEAAALDAIAATSHDLDNAALEWQHRYDARPVTTAERTDFEALASGRVGAHDSGQVIGIDEAVYAAVSLAGPEAPVIRQQAETAAHELLREDTAATERARRASAVAARTGTGPLRGPAAQASNPRPEPWPPDDPSPGTAPRV